MSSISLLLLRVHDLTMKLNYSEPKLYNGGIDPKNWGKLSTQEKSKALGKSWYMYYSYRNNKTGKLERQSNIKGAVNNYKTFRERMRELKAMQKAMLLILEQGFNPHNKNKFQYVTDPNIDSYKIIDNAVKSPILTTHIEEENKASIFSFVEAKKLVFNIKEKVLNENSFPIFKNRIDIFEKWLIKQEVNIKEDISKIDKKTVIKFLNDTLTRTSARNRNNYRVELSSFFQTLVDNDILENNFIQSINRLKTTPVRNKTYTQDQQKDIFEYMQSNDPTLLFFVQFLCYNFLRPIEVCILKIKDLNLVEKKLYVKAKNKAVKTKIIPDILIQKLPDLSKFNKDDFLFTPKGIGGQWNVLERDKRNNFTKRYKKIKTHFDLGAEYGLYSFRHTFITKLYREMIKNGTAFEVKSKMQLITGHSTMTALEAYLRDIDAQLPEDYSNLIK